jgi:hypothetical protein
LSDFQKTDESAKKIGLVFCSLLSQPARIVAEPAGHRLAPQRACDSELDLHPPALPSAGERFNFVDTKAAARWRHYFYPTERRMARYR